MTKVDINKQYRTKAGHDVRIFTTGAPEPYPVVGIVRQPAGYQPIMWTIGGVADINEELYSLVEVKPKRLVYVNLYEYDEWCVGQACYYFSEEKARGGAGDSAIAVAVPVYIEEEE